jgi:hypothetical protein
MNQSNLNNNKNNQISTTTINQVAGVSTPSTLEENVVDMEASVFGSLSSLNSNDLDFLKSSASDDGNSTISNATIIGGEEGVLEPIVSYTEQEKLEIKHFKLPGSRSKRLKAAIAAGEDYFKAKKRMIDEIMCNQAKKGGESERSTPSTSNKRGRTSYNTPEEEKKKVKLQDTFRNKLSCRKTAIVRNGYPKELLTDDQLEIIKKAILNAVMAIPEDGPAIHFQGCHQKPGWLVIDCDDETTLNWVMENTPKLNLIDGIQLKAVSGEDLPKVRYCNAYIQDENPGSPRDSEVVLTMLTKMNKGLLAKNWRILKVEQSGQKGHRYTFALDDNTSFNELKKLNFEPFFGFGRIKIVEVNSKSRSTSKNRGNQQAVVQGKPKQHQARQHTLDQGKPKVAPKISGANKANKPRSSSQGKPTTIPQRKYGNSGSTERDLRELLQNRKKQDSDRVNRKK